jgi:RNA polymerase sigma-70 factor (ECF subfamily)
MPGVVEGLATVKGTSAMSAGTDDNMPKSSGATSPSLLLQLKANQPEAWGRLVDLYAPLVYHWCKRAQLTPEDAADVFQEVFRSVAEHIKDFRRDRASDTFRGWMRTITRNKVHDLFRRRAGQAAAAGGTDAQLRLLAVPDPLAEEDPSDQQLLHQQLHATLEAIRGEFEVRTWQAFWLVQMEGRNTGDVGGELGMTTAAVRKARLRVLQRLRLELGELLE